MYIYIYMFIYLHISIIVVIAITIIMILLLIVIIKGGCEQAPAPLQLVSPTSARVTQECVDGFFR